MNAGMKRQTALGMIVELYLPADGTEHEFLWESCDNRLAAPDEVAVNILKLRQLGRTERWQHAVKRWANMVNSPENDLDPRNLRYGFLQGLIYASHNS